MISRKLRSIFRRRQAEGDLSDELQSHIELQARKYLEQGMSEADARRRARLEFGSLESAREECRDQDRLDLWDAIARNLKHALRSARLQPVFTLVAVSTLVLGIGSTLAIFNLLDSLMLRPLPIHNASQLVLISSVDRDGDFGSLPSTFLDVLRRVPDYDGVCGFDTGYPDVEVNGHITSVGSLSFTGDCFSTLGVGVQLGRQLTADDDRMGAEPVVVIGDAFWRSEFNRRRDVLGRRIIMSGHAFTIVGVAEPRFTGLLVGFSEALFVPARQELQDFLPNGKPMTYWRVRILARRASGVSEQQAATRMSVRAPNLLEEGIPPHFSAERRAAYLATKIAVTSGSGGIDYFLRRRFGGSLYAAAGICAAILLIGCTNLANLMLARCLKRRHEIVVRYALGAKWGQLAAMFAAESLLLVIPSTGLAFLFARAIDAWIVSAGARMFGNFDLSLAFNWRIGGLMALVAAVLIVGFTSASAWQASRMRDSTALKERSRGTTFQTAFTQRVLIGLQIALTLALVVSSNLLAVSLTNFYKLDLGMDIKNVWTVMLSTRPGTRAYFDRGPYYQEMIAEIGQVPGVETATVCDFVPFYTFTRDETVAALDTGNVHTELNAAEVTGSAGFFRTAGMKLIAGQEFDERPGGEPAVVISKSLAAQLGLRPRDAIGHHIRVGTDSRRSRLRIQGVVSDAQMNLAHPEQLAPPAVYLNFWQQPDRQNYSVLLIKTATNSLNLEALRKIVDSRGHEYVYRVHTLAEEKDEALIENKLLAYLSQVFGALALIMSATGLFGLLSYYVANRVNEIGVRMALGAQRWQIQWMILRQIAGVLGAGVGVGILASLAAARMIRSELFGVAGNDPSSLLLACAMLSFICLLAAWLPARRASWINPVSALRHD